MRSFRLYVGERRYLTRAGWLCLLLALVVTGGVGYLFARPLADAVGPGRGRIAVVAASGVAVWVLGWLAFRAAGFPLIAELPSDGPPDAEPGVAPDRGRR